MVSSRDGRDRKLSVGGVEAPLPIGERTGEDHEEDPPETHGPNLRPYRAVARFAAVLVEKTERGGVAFSTRTSIGVLPVGFEPTLAPV